MKPAAAVIRPSGSGGPNRPSTAPLGPEWAALAIFLSFTLVAVIGFGVYGTRPDRISGPAVMDFWAISFQFFARAHILVAAAVLALHLGRRSGWRWLPALVAVYLVSFLAEHMGTGHGLPFGDYRYTGLLGPKLGGRVPAVVPLSWFLMAVPAFVMASVTFPAHAGKGSANRGSKGALGSAGAGEPGTRGARREGSQAAKAGSRAGRIGFAAILLVVWDLALDPAMSFQVPYWIWEGSGPYYGMPWINLGGWMVTGVVIMGVLEALDGRGWTRGWTRRLDARWCAGYYAVTLLMPLGMLLAGAHWTAVGVTLSALALCGGVHRGMGAHAGRAQP